MKNLCSQLTFLLFLLLWACANPKKNKSTPKDIPLGSATSGKKFDHWQQMQLIDTFTNKLHPDTASRMPTVSYFPAYLGKKLNPVYLNYAIADINFVCRELCYQNAPGFWNGYLFQRVYRANELWAV